VSADYAGDLAATVRDVAKRLRTVTDGEAARRPAPGQWCAKEIIGHLIDSASNNHQRFVRARWQEDLVFVGYDGDAWVEAQAYGAAPWRELVDLWQEYNLHLARVMRATPEAVRQRSHTRHNLDQLAWKPIPSGEPATLDYFMRDYVDHLHHHVRQIEALVPTGR